jgi:hypothetical protein
VGDTCISSSGIAFLASGSVAGPKRQLRSPSPGAFLGRAVVPAPPFWDFAAIKQQIWSGEVPAALRNVTLPVLEDDGSSWLLLQAEAVVERYDPADSLRWRVPLDLPELAAIREDFFRRNLADSAAFRFIPLSYFVRNALYLLAWDDGAILRVLLP